MVDSAYISDDCLLDASWAVYRVTHLELSGQTLRDPTAFAQPARELNDLLQRTARGGDEYDEEDSDHAGGYQASTWQIIHPVSGPRQKPKGLLISVRYDRSTYRAVLLLNSRRSPANAPKLPILLLRMPTTLSRRFLKFCELSLSATVQPLKLSTSALCHILESYVGTLSSLPSAQQLPSYARDAALEDLPHQVLRDVRITLAFSAPIAPHLRILDIDIPFDTVWKLVQPEAENGSKSQFLPKIAEHIDRTMGLKLPWQTADEIGEEMTAPASEDLIRIARIACASFVIAAEGKIKLVGRYLEAVNDEEMAKTARKANDDLLSELIKIASDG